MDIMKMKSTVRLVQSFCNVVRVKNILNVRKKIVVEYKKVYIAL